MKDTFFDEAGDRRMEIQNLESWEALLNQIAGVLEADEKKSIKSLPAKDWDILDVGCHSGGLLNFIEDYFEGINSFSGVEPIVSLHSQVEDNLPGRECALYQTIEEVPSQSMDVVVSHEALYLVHDVTEWIKQLKRVLRPHGAAFIALGSHAENTAWQRWRPQLFKLYGHRAHAYSPVEILRMGSSLGFDMEVHRLFPETRRGMRYTPPTDDWGEYTSVKEMLEFRDQKLVFVFYPKR